MHSTLTCPKPHCCCRLAAWRIFAIAFALLMATSMSALGMCMALSAIAAHGQERLFEPDGEFELVYNTESNRIRSVTDRFLEVHVKNRRILEQMLVRLEDCSLFVCFPPFCNAEVISIFWDKSSMMMVKSDGADSSAVERFDESDATRAVRLQMKKDLDEYHFLMPLGGDGNVTPVGVCVGSSTNIVTRCFAFQEGRLFSQKKEKMFCGHRSSLPAYKAAMQIYQELTSMLESACKGTKSQALESRK